MKTLNILRKILLEQNEQKSRFQVFYENVLEKGLVSETEFRQLLSIDPEAQKDGQTISSDFNFLKAPMKELAKIKFSGFLNWIFKVYLKPTHIETEFKKGTEEYDADLKEYRRLMMEDSQAIKNLLLKYKRAKERIADPKLKDINNIGNFEDLAMVPVYPTTDKNVTVPLIRFSKNVDKGGTKDIEDITDKFDYPGSKILKIGSKYSLITIDNGDNAGAAAAQYFGGYNLLATDPSSKETNWCTSPEVPGGSHNFKYYLSQGPLFIFIPNDTSSGVGKRSGLPAERYQVHLPSNQFKDSGNVTIDFEKELMPGGKFEEFKEVFKKYFQKGVQGGGNFVVSTNSTNEATITFQSPNASARAKFERIYGKIDDNISYPNLFFEALTDVNKSVTSLLVQCEPQIFIPIPEEIGQFTNLKFLTFIGLAQSLPESICNLNELSALVLKNCEVKVIPDCVFDLPNMSMIAVPGTDIEKPGVSEDKYFYNEKSKQYIIA